MKRRQWFAPGAIISTIVATLMGMIGLTQQATADRVVPTQLEKEYAQRLVAAEAKANGGQFAEALILSEGIPVNSKHHSSIQEKQEMWAKLLLQQAREVGQRGEPQKALALLRPLAGRPNFAAEAQQLSAQWQQQAKLLTQVESAQAKEDWTGVLKSIEAIRLSDANLANTTRLQEINQIATQKAFTLPAAVAASTKAPKPVVTPISFVRDPIRLETATGPISINVGTAINPAEVEKQIRADKPSAVITPQPMPMPASVATAKALKQVTTASHLSPATQANTSEAPVHLAPLPELTPEATFVAPEAAPDEFVEESVPVNAAVQIPIPESQTNLPEPQTDSVEADQSIDTVGKIKHTKTAYKTQSGS